MKLKLASRERKQPIQFRKRFRASKQGPCLGIIALHLLDQRIKAVKLNLATQEPEERHASGLTIKIAREIKKKGFKKGLPSLSTVGRRPKLATPS